MNEIQDPVQNPSKDGNSTANQNQQNQSIDNIKNLQKVISQKDLEIQELKSKLDNNLNSLNKLEELQNIVANLENDKKINELKNQYPDILPELLLGKTEDEINHIVSKQRELTQDQLKKSYYSDINYSESEINDQIELIKKDKKISQQDKISAIFKLKRNKLNR